MSNAWHDYELLDFGDGRKLERFGEWILDRPCPAAASVAKTLLTAWRAATARFEGERAAAGSWAVTSSTRENEASLDVLIKEGDKFRLQLELLPTGQVGAFPEQYENWQWLHRTLSRQAVGVRVLNLFAYTGGSTLAALTAGAEVVHIDAARSVVGRARQNAAASRLADKPVRWIVEDSLKFCQHEVKRGNRYDAVILDPPTYGHGPKGEEWSIKRDLLPLLELCGELTELRPKFVLLTCHTPGIGPAELSAYLADGIFGSCGQPPRTGELFLETADGRRLPSGTYARWPG